MLIDKKNDLEIIARELSTDTNFNGEQITSEKQLADFARKVKFPSNVLIIRKAQNDFAKIEKGITDWETLNKIFHQFLEKYGTAFFEMDMRAMYNPTRMKVIVKATEKLIDKINSCCPHCSTPGFGITNAKKGLPCMQCDFPTRSILSYF